MRRAAFLLTVLLPVFAFAQTMRDHDPPAMMRGHHPGGTADAADLNQPSQSGQGAFGAVQEIVGILEADPNTDWRTVNIDALRQHLIDMDNVTLRADVTNEPIEGGVRFVISGTGPVRDSIQRMVTAHARIMNGVGNWAFVATNTETGAVLAVTVPANDVEKLRGLGFFGVLTRGMHHQTHHLMIARGMDPHQ